jgi:hypothetical protein
MQVLRSRFHPVLKGMIGSSVTPLRGRQKSWPRSDANQAELPLWQKSAMRHDIGGSDLGSTIRGSSYGGFVAVPG